MHSTPTRSLQAPRGGYRPRYRHTILPGVVREPLQQHLYKVKALHERDLATGTGGVALPHAIERTYPNANREWGWQWVFPPSSHYIDRETGIRRRQLNQADLIPFANTVLTNH